MPAEIEIDSELESTVAENVTGKAFVATESAAFSDKKPKRPPGRARKDGAPPGTVSSALAKDVPSPKYTSFYSDHDNAAQKTRAAWTWWKGLKPTQQDLLDAHVYRTWPVLLDPIDESEHKYIDKIIGAEPIQNDQDFTDRWGAGDYTLYLNVNPANGQRRTLFIAHVKCTHDFRKFTPTDRRIDNIANLSVTDPANAAYVAWLRASGKIPDEVKDAKEKEEMATATQGLTEVLGKALDRGDRLMEKLMDERTAEPEPSEPQPSPKEIFSDQVTMFKAIKELVPTSDPLEMVRQVVGMAQVLVQQKAPSEEIKPLMDRIDRLQDQLRTTEVEGLRSQLNEIKEQLRTKENPNPSVISSDGASLEGIVQRVVEKFMDKPDENPWLDVFKQGLPLIAPALNAFAARLMMPTPQAAPPTFPMPPATYQAGAPQQAQLPPPAQPQQQPAAQQQPQQGTPEQLEVQRILTAISAPVIDALSDGRDGDDFADFVREEFGAQAQRLLAKFEEQEIIGALYMFPLIAPRITQFPQDRVAKFVHDFKSYDRDKYDTKMDAKGGAA